MKNAKMSDKGYRLYDEVYDEDANIRGVIMELKGNVARVLWANCTVGTVDFTKCPEIKLTGKSYVGIPVEELIMRLEGLGWENNNVNS
ncbi:hypothetical protein [Pseudobutyrivibrio sp. 49]|uniref:hypothetical protein n=1 Tax=Pseudobutyrivibrio sp. 49 TaxID=1855344 RepID=UPI00115FDA76|nr:hypothetical protein [Pseudobutyrivibrio sp. 49]